MATLAATPSAAPLRLTRRGRLTLLVTAVAVALMALVPMGQAAFGRPETPHAVVIVHPGDTLWSVARAVAPTADPRDVIEQVRALNGLSDDDTLASGQRLLVPSVP